MQKDFIWQRHPRAEKYLFTMLYEYYKKNSTIASLAEELTRLTSTRLFDWIDHFVAMNSPRTQHELDDLGFEIEEVASPGVVFQHPGALLPRVLLVHPFDMIASGIAVKVDSIADFLMVHKISLPIEGSLLGHYRRCLVREENYVGLYAVERRGSRNLQPADESDQHAEKYLTALERWQTRPRGHEDEEFAMQETLKLARELAALLGKDLVAHIILEGERKYWQARNTAGQVQKSRQDRVGMGWANHDHHTFRSSRRHFKNLVELFESVGFYCREKFYAGEEAGWGAQVMENSNSGHVLFLDVDLSPQEVDRDFAHEPLPELDHLGTIGLWCALHGDSILSAGMHHLEAQFNFDDLVASLKKFGVSTMEPFSNFSYLRQAFTKGEVWPVERKRIESLLKQGLISRQDADKFAREGAVGSHLENLQRRDGFKGFNQSNVSKIIQKTDPRKYN